MMHPETPLPEVAAYLGQATANLLLRETIQVQMAVLTALRSYIILIEAEGVLDPIALQDKLHKFVDCFLLAYHGMRRA